MNVMHVCMCVCVGGLIASQNLNLYRKRLVSIAPYAIIMYSVLATSELTPARIPDNFSTAVMTK